MAIFKTIGISDDARHAIANAIFSAITNDIPEVIQDNNLPTSYGAGQFRWNFINRNVLNNLDGCFQTSIVKRGAYPCLIIYDSTTGFTFSIMSEKNFSKLQKRLPTGIHYLEALVSKNTGYDIIEGQVSLDFPEIPVRDQTCIESLRNQLLNDFTGIIENHLLITFEYSYSRVISARVILVTPEFGVAFSEDWSRFLDTPYIIGKASILEELNKDDENESLVQLKEKPMDESSDQLSSLPNTPDVANI